MIPESMPELNCESVPKSLDVILTTLSDRIKLAYASAPRRFVEDIIAAISALTPGGCMITRWNATPDRA